MLFSLLIISVIHQIIKLSQSVFKFILFLAGETGRADVKIYLISDLNRVSFRFLNTLQYVEENIDFVSNRTPNF